MKNLLRNFKAMQTSHLFVYGSLLSGFQSQAYEYIRKYFRLLGEATVNGTMYDMGEFPVVVPQKTGRVVRGELYQIINENEFSFAMAQLDDYEGLYPEEGEAVYYEREAVDVSFNNETLTAWVYWYNRDVSEKRIVESGDMREYLKGNKA